MLDIIVRRDSCGPYKHEDVIQPLLGNSVEAGICLGSAILDQEGVGAQEVEYLIYYQPGLICGMHVTLFDTLALEVIHGKIVSITHSVERTDGTSIVPKTTLKLRVPTSFYSKPT